MSLPDPDVPSTLACTPLHRAGDARIGNSQRTRITVPDELLRYMERHCGDQQPVLILGTGEHVWEPFLIAEALEQSNVNVRFSSTTRSPILTRHAIGSAYSFKDHEELGITNYLYNVNPDDYPVIIICIDTAIENLDMSLVAALKAHLLFDNRFIEHPMLSASTGSVKPATLILRDD